MPASVYAVGGVVVVGVVAAAAAAAAAVVEVEEEEDVSLAGTVVALRTAGGRVGSFFSTLSSSI